LKLLWDLDGCILTVFHRDFSFIHSWDMGVAGWAQHLLPIPSLPLDKVVVSCLLESLQSTCCGFAVREGIPGFRPSNCEGTADIFPSRGGEWLGGELVDGGVPHVSAALVLLDGSGHVFGRCCLRIFGELQQCIL